MEVPRLGVQSELQLPAYATATTMRDSSHICDLHHSSWQHWILIHWAGPEIEPTYLWVLVGFVTTEPQRELLMMYVLTGIRWIKNAPESGHRGNLPQHNKGHVQQTHSQHHTQWWKGKSISSKVGNKTKMPTLATSFQHIFGSPSHSNQRRKEIKVIHIGKEDVKLSVFLDDMILHRENSKNTYGKLLGLISEIW